MIDKPTIARIMDATNIVDVVSEFVSLKKRGVNYIGLCPFHNDSHPSFSVSPARGMRSHATERSMFMLPNTATML